jgi:hypothetical protein
VKLPAQGGRELLPAEQGGLEERLPPLPTGMHIGEVSSGLGLVM